jgi:hypothetical protein
MLLYGHVSQSLERRSGYFQAFKGQSFCLLFNGWLGCSLSAQASLC